MVITKPVRQGAAAIEFANEIWMIRTCSALRGAGMTTRPVERAAHLDRHQLVDIGQWQGFQSALHAHDDACIVRQNAPEQNASIAHSAFV